MTTLALRWLLPWASVFAVSSTLAFAFERTMADDATRLQASAAPLVRLASAAPAQLSIVAADTQGNEIHGSCLTTLARLSLMRDVYSYELERFEANLCAD
jgi:hypothetical protein